MYERLRDTVDHLHEGVQIIDRDWRYVYVNRTAAIHGRRQADELIGRTVFECYPGIEHTPLYESLVRVMSTRRAETLRHELAYSSDDVRWFDVIVDAVPDGICVLSLDVTERRKTELELHHAQRMDALGKLAGGIAHDFNNQLTAILGFTDFVLEKQTDPELRRDLTQVKEAAERSAELTRQLLAFSRRQVLKVQPIEVNAVVANIGHLLARLLGADITYDVRLHDGPAVILADARQLENVLTNLAVNARDAMPQGGRLTITTTVEQIVDGMAAPHFPNVSSGRYAVLTVTDTGHGMDAATQARIFEPFFTTKTAGRGTGLGLPMVYGVVTQMNGFIRVWSEPGRGTTFRLYFPTTSELPVAPASTAPALHRQGTARVLVIEDDPRVRELVTVALSTHGYAAHGAANGAEAYQHLLDADYVPDLVLTDVVLPGTSGPQLLDMLPLRGTRVLLMSGYSRSYLSDRGVAEEYPVLEKPFSIRELLQAVQDALGPG